MVLLIDRLPELRQDMEDLADPERVEPMQAYLKDKFVCLGLTAGNCTIAAKPAINAVKLATEAELFDFATACFDEPEREFHHVGANALRRGAKNLSALALPQIRTFIETNSWWDTVDNLASNTVGPVLLGHPQLRKEMDTWIDDDNFWVARTAIIHQLKYKHDTDQDQLFRFALRRADDTEFFIRKAIGWSLRQHARLEPDAVRHFIAANEAKFSGLTKREALKHLS